MPFTPFTMHLLLLLLLCTVAGAGEGIRLITPGGELAPVARWSGPTPEWSDGSTLVAVNGADVTATSADSGQMLWQARQPDGRRLRALQLHDHHLLLCRLPVRAGDGWDFTGCAEVLRLDTRNGAWAERLTVAGTDPLLVSGVALDGERLFVARHRWAASAEGGWAPSGLVITAHAGPRTLWTRTWPCLPPQPGPGAFLLTKQQPVTAPETVEPCRVWGDALVVCPGPSSPLFTVAAADGADRWTLERIWEYDRDFIGPSVWCHTMRRFGRDKSHEAWQRAGTKTVNVTPEDKALVDAQIPLVIADWRQAFDRDHVAWIAGGPWVVARPAEHGRRQDDALLIAVAIAPRHGFVRNLARVRLYDLSKQGEPLALIDLPRPVDQAQVLPGTLAFSVRPGGAGAVRTFPHDGPRGGMGGGPDCLLALAWYGEAETTPADAWLQTQAMPAMTLGERHAIIPCDGGAVLREGESVLVSALQVVTLADGARQRWRLHLPLGTAPTLPTTNYRRFSRADGSLGTISLTGISSDAPTAYRFLAGRLLVSLGGNVQVVFTPVLP